MQILWCNSSVNWANINVLSQVIHSVNERKTVQTNMISFVSHGAGILKFSWSLCFTKFLLRSPAECPANRNIIFRLYHFSFHKPIKSRFVRGRLYMPNQRYGLHHRICNLRYEPLVIRRTPMREWQKSICILKVN